MKRYEMNKQKEGSITYFFIRDTETWDIVLLPTKYLMHMTKAKCSPNTVRRSGCSILYYLEYIEEKEKKLTVKDIVEECQITRQAFYYHFEGIPDMIQWSIKQGTRRLLEACKEQGGAEAALKYLFVFAINAIPEVRKGIESNYGKELEQTLMQGTYELFESIVEEENLYRNYSRQELKLILRYHSHAIFGIFQDWTPEDTKNLDMIVHEVYLIMMGKNAPEEL